MSQSIEEEPPITPDPILSAQEEGARAGIRTVANDFSQNMTLVLGYREMLDLPEDFAQAIDDLAEKINFYRNAANRGSLRFDTNPFNQRIVEVLSDNPQPQQLL